MDLSIIIPVYNVEKYIGNTLQSIVSQPYGCLKCEVIVVDDGTPDYSMQIVDSYREILPQLHVISQENQGLSSARNTGLKMASGDYVWFVDSDDTITNNAFEIICDILSRSKPDIIGFSVNKINENSGEKSIEPCVFKKKHNKYYYKELPGIFLHNKIHSGLAQRYIYNRNFLVANNLHFFPGIYFEDNEFLVRAKCLAKTVLLTDKIIYNYFTGHNGSIMSTFSSKHLCDDLTVINNFKIFREANINNSRIVSIMNGAIFNETYWLLSLKGKDIVGYNDYMDKHKKGLLKTAINYGVKSIFPITMGKLKKRCFLIKFLLTQ